MASATELDFLVLDAGAIIRGHGLNLFKNTKTIVTVHEVLAEIRDSKARDLLHSLPYEIEERTPSAEAFRAVVEYAKKTGDFAALSKTDLKLIALTYMLEVEIHGSVIAKNVNSLKKDFRAAPTAVPVTKSTSTVTPTPTNFFETAGEEFVAPEVVIVEESEDEEEEVAEEKEEVSQSLEEEFKPKVTFVEDTTPIVELTADMFPALSLTGKSHVIHMTDETVPETDSSETPIVVKPSLSWATVLKNKPTTIRPPYVPRPVENFKITPAVRIVDPSLVVDEEGEFTPVTSKSASTVKTQSHSNIITRQSGLGSTVAESQRLALEDDGVGWINTENLTSHMSYAGGQLGVRSTDGPIDGVTGLSKKKKKAAAAKRAVKVACVTTDFSMQNVLMQIGLNIMSVDGLVIRSVKQWVLRCMACYQIHYDMDRLFCVKCGTNHLSRVSASIDSDTGLLRLHLKKNYQNDTKGTKYSLPAPGKQDRYSGELLLREDQLLSGIWRQKCVKIRKDIKSVFGEDVTSDVGMHINKSQAIKVGLGQRNPNATKGRERDAARPRNRVRGLNSGGQ